MSWKIPRRFRPIVFAAVMSAFSVMLVSGTLTLRHWGWHAGFMRDWWHAFCTAWPVVFLAILLVAPLVGRLVECIVASE